MDLSIVIPAYNEEESIPITIEKITELFSNTNIRYELIIVDNGSYDKTPKIITSYMKTNKNVRLVTVKKNEGWGNGVLKGCEQAQGKFITYTTADFQTPVTDILRVYEKIKNEDGKVVIKITRVSRNDGLSRYLFSKFFNSLINILFGFISTDINGTPKIIQKSILKNLNLRYKDYFLDAELMIKSKKNGFKILEIPTSSIKRKLGKSNVNIIKDSIMLLCEILHYRVNSK